MGHHCYEKKKVFISMILFIKLLCFSKCFLSLDGSLPTTQAATEPPVAATKQLAEKV